MFETTYAIQVNYVGIISSPPELMDFNLFEENMLIANNKCGLC